MSIDVLKNLQIKANAQIVRTCVSRLDTLNMTEEKED